MPGNERGLYEESLNNNETLPQESERWSAPEFDPAEYREHVEDFDITEEQKDELLRILWSIAVAFVDLGFGVDSVHRILPGLIEISSPPESAALKKNNQQFNAAATGANKDGEDEE